MNKKVIKTSLPNGMQISCFNSNEAYILYNQASEYIKYGVTLEKGDFVLDIGANIGLFALWIYSVYKDSISIYSFEPIPDIYEVLKANIEQLNTTNIKTFPFGISNKSQSTTFGYYPNASALSSAYPDNSNVEKDMFKNAIVNNLSSMSKDAPFSLKILRYLPKNILSFTLNRILKRAFEINYIDCKMKTLSAVINDYGVGSIDLLKIDVEKSEFDVIHGIHDNDWSKIKQTVIEVHDINNRVDKLTGILRKQGFTKVNVGQESDLKGTNIYSVYALR